MTIFSWKRLPNTPLSQQHQRAFSTAKLSETSNWPVATTIRPLDSRFPSPPPFLFRYLLISTFPDFVFALLYFFHAHYKGNSWNDVTQSTAIPYYERCNPKYREWRSSWSQEFMILRMTFNASKVTRSRPPMGSATIQKGLKLFRKTKLWNISLK